MDETHELRKVDDLITHPLYHSYYPEISETTIQRFIAAIQQSDYISPLIITAENIILDGHHRYWAVKRMGIETVPVTVKETSEKEASNLLTTYNCARNKSMEEKIFLAKRIKATFEYHEIKPGPNHCHDGTKVTAKDIAKMFDMSYRTMLRTLKLLDVIPELQNKFKNDEIGIRAIEKVANELDEQQQRILYSQIFDRRLKEEALSELINVLNEDRAFEFEASDSIPTEVINKKSKVIIDAEKNLKRLHEKIILHTHIFKENPRTVHMILLGLEDIKRELEEINHG